MRKFGLMLVWALGLAACGSGGGSQSGTVAKQSVTVPFDWMPEKVSLTCPSGDCPEATGVLIFGRSNEKKKNELNRCTATLISADTLLTNAHCDDEMPNYTHAYFILPGQNGKPVVAKVIQKVYEEMGALKGFDRDMAIYRLDRTMPATPQRIARETPAHLETLIAYAVDRLPGDTDFTKLTLRKKECRINRTNPLLGAGSEDKNRGLALFDCEVLHGNSGSAMYVPGDNMNIHALMNSIWAMSDESSAIASKARGMFYLLPEFLQKNFGFAERLHCADIPGQPQPAEHCRRADLDQSGGVKLRAAAQLAVDQWLNSVPKGFGGFEWTIDVVDGEVALADGKKFAVALLPRPFCVTGSASAGPVDVRVALPVMRLGLHPNGNAEARIVFQKEMNFHLVKTSGSEDYLVSLTVGDLVAQNIDFTSSARTAGIFNRATLAVQKIRIPNCGPNSRAEAGRRAMRSVGQNVKVLESEFTQ